MRGYARVVRWADLETLHEVRIAAKRLRDSLDLLGDILGPERIWLTDRLVALQDHLGTTNDVAVTARAVRTFLEDRHQRLPQAERIEIAAYLADRERTVGRLRRGVGRPWRAVSGISFARRLSRLVVLTAYRLQPRVSAGSSDRQPAPAWCAARSSPSRRPPGATRRRPSP